MIDFERDLNVKLMMAISFVLTAGLACYESPHIVGQYMPCGWANHECGSDLVCVDHTCLTIGDDGIWVDPDTGLMWLNHVSAYNANAVTYADAEEYCATLALGAYNDWRLPTISEQRTLIRGCSNTMTGGVCEVTDETPEWRPNDDTSNCITACKYGDGPSESGDYLVETLKSNCGVVGDEEWTQTVIKGFDLDARWTVDFSSGNIEWRSIGDQIADARCVR